MALWPLDVHGYARVDYWCSPPVRSLWVEATLFQDVQQGNRTAMTCHDQRHTNEASLLPGAMAKSSKLTKRLSWAAIFFDLFEIERTRHRTLDLHSWLRVCNFHINKSTSTVTPLLWKFCKQHTRDQFKIFVHLNGREDATGALKQTRTNKAWVNKMKMPWPTVTAKEFAAASGSFFAANELVQWDGDCWPRPLSCQSCQSCPLGSDGPAPGSCSFSDAVSW